MDFFFNNAFHSYSVLRTLQNSKLTQIVLNKYYFKMPLDGYLLYRVSVILLRGTQFKELKFSLLSVEFQMYNVIISTIIVKSING